MSNTPFFYITFSIVIMLALVTDLGLLSKRNSVITIRVALIQTLFWVMLSFAFCAFLWYENAGGNGKAAAIKYVSAYLLEWSLSIDNIFVFIIIISFFKIQPKNYPRVLLTGIVIAILLRIIFITVGSGLISNFQWVIYILGGFLFYTGITLFVAEEHSEFNPANSRGYRLVNRFFRISEMESSGNFFIRNDGKLYLSKPGIAVIMLGLTDIVFAIDSIPAVFSIIPDPHDKMLIYSSNIFAVLGLRSLFFLMRGAANKFKYLQQGIAFVLLFIGSKMLLAKWVDIPTWISLIVIMFCIGIAIIYSVIKNAQPAKSH